MFGWGSIPDRENHIVCSPSALIAFRNDPEVYKMRYIDKEEYQTDSMEFGTLVHLRVLQPEKFFNEYAILPDKTPENDFDSESLKSLCKSLGEKVTGTKRELAERIRSHNPEFKIYEEIVDEIASNGKKTLPPSTLKKLNAINDKIMSHPKVSQWIQLAEKEKKGYWQDPETGIVMPFLADAFFEHKGVGIVIDLKITTYWESRRFQNTNYDEGRGIQAAAYCKAISAITGREFSNFLFIAIEPNAPHRVRYYQADHGMLEAGATELRHYLKEFKERWTSKDFGPRSEDIEIQTTSLASWNWDKIPEVDNGI